MLQLVGIIEARTIVSEVGWPMAFNVTVTAVHLLPLLSLQEELANALLLVPPVQLRCLLYQLCSQGVISCTMSVIGPESLSQQAKEAWEGACASVGEWATEMLHEEVQSSRVYRSKAGYAGLMGWIIPNGK